MEKEILELRQNGMGYKKFNHFVEIINMPFRDGNVSGEKPCELLETLRHKYQML